MRRRRRAAFDGTRVHTARRGDHGDSAPATPTAVEAKPRHITPPVPADAYNPFRLVTRLLRHTPPDRANAALRAHGGNRRLAVPFVPLLVSAATEGAARKGSNPAGGANIWPSQRCFLKGPLDHRAISVR